jgi:hypothetical protein
VGAASGFNNEKTIKKNCNRNFFSLAEYIGVGTLAASTLVKFFVGFFEIFTNFFFFFQRVFFW